MMMLKRVPGGLGGAEGECVIERDKACECV